MYRQFFIAALALLCITFAPRSNAVEPTSGIPCDDLHTYAAILPQDAFNPSAFSVSAWIKTDKPGESQGVLDVGAPSKFFSFYVYGGGFRMLASKDSVSGEYAFAIAPAPAKDAWTHYCGSYDGKTIRVFMNGKLVQEKSFVSELKSSDYAGRLLRIGAMDPKAQRPFHGTLNDVALWNRVLSADEVAALYERGIDGVSEKPIASWSAKGLSEDGERLVADGADSFSAERVAFEPLLNQKDSGYRGVWYYNQKINNEYVYKYSGGMGTYPANHYPFAVYRPEVDMTFFCYGGFDPSETTLWHEVGAYDHKTKKVSRPTVLVDKMTEDAHDNPVMSMDDEGRIWVFSTSHGTGRPSYIHRSVRPYDISEFELVEPTKVVGDAKVPMNNFSYF
ncbi:MAG: hypothetical protein J6X44_02735, partial [Thermoguttaceae bacterium]|nr:hypothetical protein [Thermoguttaceae bacterium]